MKTITQFTLTGFIACGIFAAHLSQAQVGNDNPDGPAGIFNGDILTAGQFDPYTGNTTRAVTDIVVANGVGTQPLALTRTYNSRRSGDFVFGTSGCWTHSYRWVSYDSPETSWHQSQKPGAYSPTTYTIGFPDGRYEVFTYSASDIYYRSAAGITDRVIPLNTTTLLAYLVLNDGSKIEFKGTQQFDHDIEDGIWYSWYTYVAQAIIDPYGLRTTLTYNVDATLQKVTEPAGRYLQFYYSTVGGNTVIDHVTASDGRSVQYSYIQSTFSPGTVSYVCLDHIVYYNDATWTAHYTYCAPNTGSANGPPLLWKCDDPMYGGPMRRIAYVYKTTNNVDGSSPVYGQILSENYYDGTNVGAALTTLSVNNSVRTETRADTKTRTFTYTSALLTSCTDFKGISASQAYDSNSYVNAVTDRDGHTTNYTLNALTGRLLTTTFPSTPSDTPVGTPRGVVTYTYGWASCPDVNNRDANNPYYLYSITDEGSHATIFTRDSNKRVTRIDYPDGGYETFSYNSFGEVLSHLLKAGGTETFSYDARGLKQTYRDPYHATGNPSAWYQYDTLDRVSGVTDALGTASGDVNHTTGQTYSARGQPLITTHPTDPVDGLRHTITNAYNPEGTLASTIDELSHETDYTYDEYKRLATKKTPQRAAGDNTPRITYFYYDATGVGYDYTHTDSNVTHTTLPSGKKITAIYDENHRKTSVIVGAGTSDAATTSYGYDNAGNVTSVLSPLEQAGQINSGKSTVTAYDERNRPMTITDALNDPSTTMQYDAAGRKSKVTRPNGQVATFDSYDAMNRLLQQTVKQTPDPDAVTKYTYYSSGLLHTMQDPHLSSGSYNYSYAYDTMGRKTGLTYPQATATATPTAESWHYDTAGRNDTFTNRNGKVRTTNYDALNRPTSVSWNDSGVTPTVTFGYDVASRTTSITNTNATVTRGYLNDNLLSTETTTLADTTARTVTYTYAPDGNRGTLQYPANAYNFTYAYTNRNQLSGVTNTSGGTSVIGYTYDLDGNLASRTPNDSTSSSYTYDAMDRATHISHGLVSGARTFDYAYDSVGNRKWTKRDSGTGDVFGYDVSDQVTATLLDVASPDTTSPGSQTIIYDANGNRTSFAAYGTTYTYSTNNLNQYSSRNASNAVYNADGSVTTGVDGSTYTYDAQERLLIATKGSCTYTFKYDGLDRQVSRLITGTPSAPVVYNVYDGWDLIGEYNSGATTPATAYVYGAGGLVKLMTSSSTYYYYQDAAGCTSHLADNTGHLVEWYRYDLQGTPFVYDSSNTLRSSGSIYGIRHLFTSQQWYSDLALYDLRNRFYSPDIGRFLQGDPAGFSGDASNLYRYCGNNPLKYVDPNGTTARIQGGGGGGCWARVVARFASQGITLRGDDYGNLDGSAGGSPITDGFGGFVKDGDWAFLSSPDFGGDPRFATAPPPVAPSRGNVILGWIDRDDNSTDTVEVITDAQMSKDLNFVYGDLSELDVGSMPWSQFKEFMESYDTRFYGAGVYYYDSAIGSYNGTWTGYEINYIGVGEAFAAAGYTSTQMQTFVAGWNLYNYPLEFTSDLAAKMNFASLGYNYYNYKSGGTGW